MCKRLAGIVTRMGVPVRQPPDGRNTEKESLCAGGAGVCFSRMQPCSPLAWCANMEFENGWFVWTSLLLTEPAVTWLQVEQPWGRDLYTGAKSACQRKE
jgi:hypothetical protein